MGELKDLREQEESLFGKYKQFNKNLFLAALGAVSRVEEEVEKRYDEIVAAGEEVLGDDAEDTNKYVVAVRGLISRIQDEVENLPENVKEQFETLQDKPEELFNKYVETGSEERGDEAEDTNKYVLAGIGAFTTAREESTRIFDELVEAGEKRAA